MEDMEFQELCRLVANADRIAAALEEIVNILHKKEFSA